MSCRPLPFGAHVTKVTAAFLEPHSKKKKRDSKYFVWSELEEL